MDALEAHVVATIKKPPPPDEWIDFELCLGLHCTSEYLDDMAEDDLQLYREFMRLKLAMFHAQAGR